MAQTMLLDRNFCSIEKRDAAQGGRLRLAPTDRLDDAVGGYPPDDAAAFFYRTGFFRVPMAADLLQIVVPIDEKISR
jgi:hypothetical protein